MPKLSKHIVKGILCHFNQYVLNLDHNMQVFNSCTHLFQELFRFSCHNFKIPCYIYQGLNFIKNPFHMYVSLISSKIFTAFQQGLECHLSQKLQLWWRWLVSRGEPASDTGEVRRREQNDERGRENCSHSNGIREKLTRWDACAVLLQSVCACVDFHTHLSMLPSPL